MFILIKVIFLAILFLFSSEIIKIFIGKRIKREILKELQGYGERKGIKNKELIAFIGIIASLLLLGYDLLYSVVILVIILFLVYGIKNIRKNIYKNRRL